MICLISDRKGVDFSVQKFVLALCMVALLSSWGCSQASSRAAGQESFQADGQAAQAQSSAESSTADSSEMPEFDFGFDEAVYFAETYKLDNAEYLDLINRDQLVWIANNECRAAIAICDASDERSVAMLANAQKTANDMREDLFVYEPARDAAESEHDALVSELVEEGLANLKTLEPGTIISLSKLTVDSSGNPAPVTNVVSDPDEAADAVRDTYSLSCCE